MRILLVHPGPPLSQHDVWRGYEKALLDLGHTVTSFRTDQVLLRGRQWPPSADLVASMQFRLRRFQQDGDFDLTILVGNSFINIDTVRALKAPVVLMHTESPYEDRRQLALAPYVAANLTSDPLTLSDYEAVGRPALLFSPAYDPEIHYPSEELKDIEFIFIGTALPSRVAFFTSMALDDVDACIDGGGWSHNGVANEDAAGLYRRAQVGINFYRREGDTDKGWTMGPRELEMAACGLFFLRDPRGEGDAVLDMLPTFATPDEATGLLHYWLAHPEERKACATLAAEAVKDRTFGHQTARIMTFLKETL